MSQYHLPQRQRKRLILLQEFLEKIEECLVGSVLDVVSENKLHIGASALLHGLSGVIENLIIACVLELKAAFVQEKLFDDFYVSWVMLHQIIQSG